MEVFLRSNFPEIGRWLKSTFPEEGCGLLVQCLEGLEWVPARNVATQQRASFEVDPVVLLAQLVAGKRVVCVVHSHANSSPDFSETDLRGAIYEGEGGVREIFPGARHLVISLVAGQLGSSKLYRFDGEHYVAEKTWPATYWQLSPNAFPL